MENSIQCVFKLFFVRSPEMHEKHPKNSDSMETRPMSPIVNSILVQGYKYLEASFMKIIIMREPNSSVAL